MKNALWVITIIFSLIGGLIVIYGVSIANSAPQEASAIAFGLAWAIIPYCIARAVSELSSDSTKYAAKYNLKIMQLDYPAFFTKFYQEVNPEKVKDIPSLLNRYKGKEDLLYQKMCLQYKINGQEFLNSFKASNHNPPTNS